MAWPQCSVAAGDGSRGHRHSDGGGAPQLAEQGIELDRGTGRAGENSQLINREDFVDKVWEWKDRFRRRHPGAAEAVSAPPATGRRERFTMGLSGLPDDQAVRAVTKVFVDLFTLRTT